MARKTRVGSSQLDRMARIGQVVLEALSRRSAGEDLPDESILSAHPDLLPELAQELSALRLINRARFSAEVTRTSPHNAAVTSETDAGRGAAPLTERLPGYTILRELHRGGQGVVYLAIQNATRRKVAVKVMLQGPFVGARDIIRFEREVQILASLNHPHIVAVHDSGTAPSGAFYYVMDYISGQPLDQWISSGRSPLADLKHARRPSGNRNSAIDHVLRLFAKICEAVNAAHLRGVIHRDLKPGNICIDGDGEPHILDFGLAKVATGDVMTGSQPGMMTTTGQFVGSLPWASPEQAEGSLDKLDLRTDVYSLGVILYQMLTGRFPYTVAGNMRDVLDNILTAEPARPGAVRAEINDEVETIVLKCLAKERERRYQTAGEVARDISHYLAGEPINAKRESTWYVLRKQLRRHRFGMAVSAVIALLILGGFATTFALWQRAARARDAAELSRAAEVIQRAAAQAAQREAEVSRDEAELARAAEASQRDLATAEAQQRTEMATFLLGMIGKLAPGLSGGKELSVSDMLDWAAENLDKQRLQPDDEARLKYAIGKIYRLIGDHVTAVKHLRRSLELRREHPPEARVLADTLHELGAALWWNGQYREAEEFYRESLRMRQERFGRHHDVAMSLNHLAAARLQQGYPEEAEQLNREALAMRLELDAPNEDTIFVARARNNLAKVYLDVEDYEHAAELFTRVEATLRDLDEQDPEIPRALNNIAMCHLRLGGHERAREKFEAALSKADEMLGPEHPFIADGKHGLAELYLAEGRLQEAYELCTKGLDLRTKRLREDHPEIAYSEALLGGILMAMDDLAGAEEHLRNAVRIRRKEVPDHWRTAEAESLLGQCLFRLGRTRYADAEASLLEGYDGLEEKRGSDAASTRAASQRLFDLYEAWGEPELAAQYRTEAADR